MEAAWLRMQLGQLYLQAAAIEKGLPPASLPASGHTAERTA
jgi:hypothetical protein